ncbi:MAG: hypothetical protein M3Q68_05005, partial [Actinomycetota bacterium]|nr:hypothetical protein [Actinomycetota bacterium]
LAAGTRCSYGVNPKSKPSAASGAGYYVLGSDGGIFTFGEAPYLGSVPGAGLCSWPKGVQMAPTATGQGYWVVGEEGSVFAFGDAALLGDVPGAGVKGVRAVDLGVVRRN